MKAKTLIILIVIIAILAVVKLVFLTPKQEQPGNGATAKAPVALVQAVAVKNAEVQNVITLAASLLANEEVELKPETAGKIIQLLITEGAKVQKGQLLVKINDANLQAQLKKMVVQQKLAEEKEQRLKQLLSIKGVSQDEYDVALTAFNAANADVELLKAQIMDTEVRAPFDGTVGLKNISVGSYVSTADIIATMQQLDPIKVDFTVPQKNAAQVHIGDTVMVHIEGQAKNFAARIYAFDPKIDPSTRSLKVRAQLNNGKFEVFPGSYAQVSLVLHSQRSVVIPSTAVIPDLRGQKTYVVKGGKANLVLIETGVRTDSTIEVTSGLITGDTVITSGIMGLKPGMQVKIQKIK
jgi:membrane fusion protein (multidrug efflux system)